MPGGPVDRALGKRGYHKLLPENCFDEFGVMIWLEPGVRLLVIDKPLDFVLVILIVLESMVCDHLLRPPSGTEKYHWVDPISGQETGPTITDSGFNEAR